MDEPQVIAYRRLVSYIATQLSPTNVEHIAYVRLTGKEDTTKYSGAKPTASALQLLVTLERRQCFCYGNIGGLVEIIKDVNRNDLAEVIGEHRSRWTRRSGKPVAMKRKQRKIRSEERQQLEEVHDMTLTTCVALEDHAIQFRETLREDTITQEGASKLLREHENIVGGLVSNLRRASEKLDFRSRSSSSCSSGSSGSTSCTEPTSPTPLNSKKMASKHIRKPVPSKREFRPFNEKTVQETVATQEKVEQQQQLVVPTRVKLPPKQLLNSSSKPPREATNETTCLSVPTNSSSKPPTMKPPPPPKIKFRERSSSVGDENDRDSGMFTGSDYDKVESWMKNIPKLPDSSQDHKYQAISMKNRDQENEYARPKKRM